MNTIQGSAIEALQDAVQVHGDDFVIECFCCTRVAMVTAGGVPHNPTVIHERSNAIALQCWVTGWQPTNQGPVCSECLLSANP